jgi:hypothetical protein
MRLVFRAHAAERMFELGVEDVQDVLKNGETVKE